MEPTTVQRHAQRPGRSGRACAAALVLGAMACVQLPVLPPLGWCWAGVLGGACLWWPQWPWRWLGTALLGLCWTALHGHWALQQQLPPDAPPLDVVVTGRVLDLPEHLPRYSRFLLRVDGPDTVPAHLRGRQLQIYWSEPFTQRDAANSAGSADNRRQQLAAGSRWQLALRLRAPRSRINPGGFDAERHALLSGIAATGNVRHPAQARQLQSARGLAAWREAMAARIAAGAPAQTARFVQALALGDTRGLDDEDWSALRALGLTHLIAISGFHVGLVAGAVALLVALGWRSHPCLPQWLPRPIAAAWAAALGAAAYALVAGLQLPTVRTALMIVVVAVCCAGRRRPSAGQALALAAWATLLVAPLSVLSAGFWLSFGGVLWLLWCLPGAQPGTPRSGLLRGFLAAQAVASVALLPLVIALFGQASRIGPLVNLVAVPWWSLVVVPLALLGTALEALHAGLGAWAWSLSAWAFQVSWQAFKPMAALDGAVWWLPQATVWAVPAALLGMFWLLLPRGHGGILAGMLLCLPLLWPKVPAPAHGALELLVMDVGQGTAVLVRTAGHSLLYDLGPPGSGERVVLPVLRALGTGPPQRLMLSHGDSDHAGGLPAVRAALPQVPLLAPAGSGIATAQDCAQGLRWNWDGVAFSVLHPPAGRHARGNEDSCVLRIDSAHGTVLLAGDIGAKAEAALLADGAGAMAAQVVLVPHHGSAGSSSAAWVAATGARLALVSSGHGNRFGHPRAEVVQRWQRQGAEVLDTSRSGALRAWLDEGGLHVREQRVHAARWWDAAERGRAAAILSADKQAADGPEG